MQPTAAQILQQYWGYSSFRPLQQDIIEAVHKRADVLALLPTGGGKSVCYQIPALMRDGICIVISPLIALIKDQVAALNNKGILALSIYTGMHYNEVKQTLLNAAHGDYKFLYVSPERLGTDLFLEYLPAIKPSLIVVDEAHCISQWGYDFRPAYLKINLLRDELPGVNVIAVTASAIPQVQKDITQKLAFSSNSRLFKQSFVRHNISYSCFSPQSRQQKLLQVLQNVQGTSIVYCSSRKRTQEIAAFLRSHHITADHYHAGMKAEEKDINQQKWLEGKLPCMVCTNAFGMGIDKPNVRVVVHYDVPDSLEHYYQEAGRAGRDGKRAYAVLLHDNLQQAALKEKLNLRYPTYDFLKKLYMDLMNFLKIPAGSGEGTNHDFDVAVFAHNFKYNILQATYGIKCLADEGLLVFEESASRPSAIEFICSKTDLDDLYIQQPALGEIAKALLRNYAGIFDYPASVYEGLLAGFLKMAVADIHKLLAELHHRRIINYKPRTAQQQLYLLLNRMYADAFKVDIKKLHERKSFHENRVGGMINYCNENKLCRNNMISHYFGDDHAKNCGICDNCINMIREKNADNQYSQLAVKILALLGDAPANFNDIKKKLPGTTDAQVWDALYFLEAELRIQVDASGYFQVTGN